MVRSRAWRTARTNLRVATEVDKLRREYAQNTKLEAALADTVQQKAVVKRVESTDELRIIVPTLSRGEPGIIGHPTTPAADSAWAQRLPAIPLGIPILFPDGYLR